MLKSNEGFNFTWGMAQELLNQLGYVQVTGFMLDAYTELGLSRNEFLCIIHLARFHYNSPQGIARPSATNVAKKMGYGHPNSVRQLVKSLEGKKMLLVIRRSGKCSIYDASPFAKAAFEIWQKQNPNIPMLGSNGNTLTPQCETPSHPNVTEENEEAKELVEEKNISPIGDEIPESDLLSFSFDENGGVADVPKSKKCYIAPCEYEHEDGTTEIIEDDSWRREKKQIDNQILLSAGLEEYPSKKHWKKARRVEKKLERGEIVQRYLENRCYNAENLPWSLDTLLNSLLNPNHYRNWQEREARRKKKL